MKEIERIWRAVLIFPEQDITANRSVASPQPVFASGNPRTTRPSILMYRYGVLFTDSSSICFSKPSIVESSTPEAGIVGGATTKITRIIDSDLKSV